MAPADISEQIEASFQYNAETAGQAFKAVTVPSPEFTTHKVNKLVLDVWRKLWGIPAESGLLVVQLSYACPLVKDTKCYH